MRQSVQRITAVLASIFLLVISGCNGSGPRVIQLEIRPLVNQLMDSRNHHSQFACIYEGDELRFIVGASDHEKYTRDDLSGFTPDGELVWTVVAKRGDNNPSPETGKNEKANDYDFLPGSAVNIGDHDGDGVDDLYVTNDGRLPNHIGIVSGADGHVIVQSGTRRYWEDNERRNWLLLLPSVVFDENGDGVRDLRFVFKRDQAFQSVTLSGTDLGLIGQAIIDVEGWPDSFVIDNWKDETGDGVNEFVVYTKASKEDGDDRLVIVDGKKLEAVRSFPKMEINRLSSSTIYFRLGDINGDGTDDFGITSVNGARSNPDNAFLVGCSGADGSVVWYLDGQDVGGPEQELLSVPTDRNQESTTNRYVNNRLGENVAVVPDQNGDSIRDVVVSVALEADPNRRTLMLISGKDGTTIRQQTIKRGWMDKTVIPLIPSQNSPDSADAPLLLAVPGSLDGKSVHLIKIRL